MKQNHKYAVFSIRKTERGQVIWTRAGSAWVNRDDSMNIYLDVLPLGGQLHVREVYEKREAPGAQQSLSVGANNEPAAEAAAPMGGH